MSAPTEQQDSAARIDTVTGEDVIALEADAPDNGGWDRERHCATDLRGADWLARKWRDAQAQVALNEEMGRAEIAELQKKIAAVEARIVEANQPFRRTIAFTWDALAVFMETHREMVLKGLRSNAKSRLLPSGVRIGWKSREGGYRWDQSKTPAENKAALLAWALAEEKARDLDWPLTEPGPVQPKLDRIKEYLAAVDASVQDDDRLVKHLAPPGLEWVESGETLSITTKGGP